MAKQLKQIALMEVEKVMCTGCTDRDEGENKLIVISIPRPTICLDPIQNKNNGISSILGGKHISETRKTYHFLQKTVQEAGYIPGGDYSPENRISLDPVSNMPPCITVSTPKRIKIVLQSLVTLEPKPMVMERLSHLMQLEPGLINQSQKTYQRELHCAYFIPEFQKGEKVTAAAITLHGSFTDLPMWQSVSHHLFCHRYCLL